MKLLARVSDEGQLVAADPGRLAAYLHKHRGRLIEITMAARIKPRTIAQNALWWGQIVTPIALATDQHKDYIHPALMKILRPHEVKLGNITEVVGERTSAMDTVAFSSVVEDAVQFSAEKLSLPLSMPGDIPMFPESSPPST